jgi:hypothetical protein
MMNCSLLIFSKQYVCAAGQIYTVASKLVNNRKRTISAVSVEVIVRGTMTTQHQHPMVPCTDVVYK